MGLGFKDSEFRAEGLGSAVWASGFEARGKFSLGPRLASQGFGFRVLRVLCVTGFRV